MKNIRKQIQGIGVLLIVVGATSLLLALFPLISSDTHSPLYIIANKYFVYLVIGGLVEVLVGIVLRGIGKNGDKTDRGYALFFWAKLGLRSYAGLVTFSETSSVSF
ncbi:MAG: hypothetical protein K5695_00415 [Oscillospiraceae bacterium]|nr:hypothetical protein [Oscillospiraceae bacterium]